MMEAKQMRDQMISEAALRRKEQELAAKKHERELVMQLQKDIANEK
jgi:hypothetical protein